MPECTYRFKSTDCMCLWHILIFLECLLLWHFCRFQGSIIFLCALTQTNCVTYKYLCRTVWLSASCVIVHFPSRLYPSHYIYVLVSFCNPLYSYCCNFQILTAYVFIVDYSIYWQVSPLFSAGMILLCINLLFIFYRIAMMSIWLDRFLLTEHCFIALGKCFQVQISCGYWASQYGGENRTNVVLCDTLGI